MIVRSGQVLILPVGLATPAEVATGVDDIEALCQRAAGTYLQRRPAVFLDDDARLELVSYLMLAAWTEAARFNGRGRLDRYLGQRLQWRCADWLKSRIGRRKTPPPVILSLDAIRDQEHALDADCA